MPVDHRMYAHERRPSPIRRVEVLQIRTMGISPPRADENCFDAAEVGEVVGKGFLHGLGIACERKVVGLEARVYEVVDLCEGVGGYYVDGPESLR